jgi:putative DNA primase/helicase
LNREQQKAFLETFCNLEELDSITFQTFKDNAEKGNHLAKVVAGTLESRVSELKRLNQNGAGVFWTVNAQTDPTKRSKENTARVRAVFVDLDGAPLEPVQAFALPPTAIVESSAGRYHAYWKVSDVPLLEFSGLQKRLAAFFDGDAKVCDLPRVLRFPYFLHNKGEPFQTRILELYPELVYTLEQLNAILPHLQTTMPLEKPVPRAMTYRTSSDDAHRKYALTALENEYQNVESCTQGSRNHQLNKSAFALGQFIGAGVLSESEVSDQLENAALSCGLSTTEAKATIQSGVRSGKLEPRDLTHIGQQIASDSWHSAISGTSWCATNPKPSSTKKSDYWHSGTLTRGGTPWR